MRADSLRRSRRPPNDFIHGLSPARLTANFSASASDTNSRKAMPCWAAADFARLNSASGISSVVFISYQFPIFMGGESNRRRRSFAAHLAGRLDLPRLGALHHEIRGAVRQRLYRARGLLPSGRDEAAAI